MSGERGGLVEVVSWVELLRVGRWETIGGMEALDWREEREVGRRKDLKVVGRREILRGVVRGWGRMKGGFEKIGKKEGMERGEGWRARASLKGVERKEGRREGRA